MGAEFKAVGQYLKFLQAQLFRSRGWNLATHSNAESSVRKWSGGWYAAQLFLLAELVSFVAICLCWAIFVRTYLPQFALCLFPVASHFTSAKIIAQTASLRRIRSLITTRLKIQSPAHELLSIRPVNIGGPTRNTCGLPNLGVLYIWVLLPFPGTEALPWQTGARFLCVPFLLDGSRTLWASVEQLWAGLALPGVAS